VRAANPQLHIAKLERELQWAHLKIQVLEERLRRQRISFLGPHRAQSQIQPLAGGDLRSGPGACEARLGRFRRIVSNVRKRTDPPVPSRPQKAGSGIRDHSIGRFEPYRVDVHIARSRDKLHDVSIASEAQLCGVACSWNDRNCYDWIVLIVLNRTAGKSTMPERVHFTELEQIPSPSVCSHSARSRSSCFHALASRFSAAKSALAARRNLSRRYRSRARSKTDCMDRCSSSASRRSSS
jgi:hypothetical protein